MDDPKFMYDEEKQVTKDEKLKNFNPILIPVILGWKRQITKHRNFGKRSVYYVSPCGRRLRNMASKINFEAFLVLTLISTFRKRFIDT